MGFKERFTVKSVNEFKSKDYYTITVELRFDTKEDADAAYEAYEKLLAKE